MCIRDRGLRGWPWPAQVFRYRRVSSAAPSERRNAIQGCPKAADWSGPNLAARVRTPGGGGGLS
eukprot:7208874-Pyramimonas_sp.AAC.1